jgi:hypothetical protein
MAKNKNIVSKFLGSSPKTRNEAMMMILIVIKVQFLVWLIPLRYYYNRYFSYLDPNIPDKQRFNKYMGLFRSVINVLPVRVSCLVESMALFDILKMHGIVNPVHIGIKIGETMDAHAWNDHQRISDFKKII